MKSEITIDQVQKRQRGVNDHPKRLNMYNVPFVKMSELIPALWRLETTHKNVIGAREKVEAAVAACVLHLADYCNAKRINLAALTEKALDRIEEMERKDRENAN
jgi:hypothetical protein